MDFCNFIDTRDWEATGSMLQGIGTICGAFAVWYAARYGLRTWKKQTLAAKYRDQAEIILIAAYNARRALEYIRSPLIYFYERSNAHISLHDENAKWLKEISDEHRYCAITARVYHDRINRFREKQTDLENCLPSARAIFGEDIERAIEELYRQFQTVRESANEHSRNDSSRSKAFLYKVDKALKSGLGGIDNEIDTAIKEAVATIEKHCFPRLRLETI